METDFNYGNKTTTTKGPIQPSITNAPADARTRVETYADIKSIPAPYVGMIITVLADETNEGKMTDYKVKNLKASNLGIPNSLINEVVRYADYLGVTSGGGTGSVDLSAYATKEELELKANDSELATIAKSGSYNDLNDKPIIPSATIVEDTLTSTSTTNALSANQGKILNDAFKTALNGKKISHPMSKAEYDGIIDKDPNMIYLVDDDTAIIGIPDFSTSEANKILAVNAEGNALAWIDAPSGGTGLTEEQLNQLTAAYEHSQTKHVQPSDIPTTVAQLTDASDYAKTADLALVATSGNYNDLRNLPEIPEQKNEIYVGNINDEGANAEGIQLVLDLTEIDGELYIDGTEGSGLTTEQAQQLQAAYEHSQSPHVQASDIPTRVSELENDNSFVTTSELNAAISRIEISGGTGISYTSVDVSTDTFVICKPGFVLSSTSTTINEGSSTTFTVKLGEAPSENITVTLTSSNENVTVSPSTLTFTSSNYNATQTVTVNTVEASDYIDWSANIIVSSVGYNKATFIVNCKNISVNYGNIVTSLSSLTILEGTSGTFTVNLESQPTQNQTVSLSSNNTDVTLSPSTLTFTPSNYDTAQIVTVTIAEDSDETNDSATITLSSSNVSNVTVNVKKAVVVPMMWHFDAQQQDNSQRTSMFGLSDINGSDIVIKNALYSSGDNKQSIYDIESHWADGAYIINDNASPCLHEDLATLSPLFDKDFTIQINYLAIDENGGSVLWLGTYNNYFNCLNVRTKKVRIGDTELNTSTLSTTEQVQVIIAYEKSTNSMKIWVNGTKEYDSVLPKTLDTQQSFAVGTGRLGGLFKSKIYSLRIYNYVISDEVASELYTTESAIEGRA